jgi:long-chain acyl-CoA synthetase
VKAANATLGPNQRVAGWRLWPESDFPRTHTLKVKRDLVRAWAGANPL